MYSISDAIIQQNTQQIAVMLQHQADLNSIDEYGFTPLIQAAIVDNIDIARMLLQAGAQPNKQDVTGGTALQWAIENSNLDFCELLLRNGADPNAYSLAGQPVMTMAILRGKKKIRELLIQHGAQIEFTQDYINTKLLGHMFELSGIATIISPNNEFIDVDFEGFYLETTLGLVADSLAQFQNHFAARHLRKYSGVSLFIVDVLQRASQLIKYQQYQVNITQHMQQIDEMIAQDPVIIPVGYEGHAITFIKYGKTWVKCDRREDSRLYDTVTFYDVGHLARLTPDFMKSLIYKKQSDQFINEEMDRYLDLTPITELKVEAQIAGNCTWANVEATIPALFYLILAAMHPDEKRDPHYKTLALNLFHRWREWNKDRALNFCMQRFRQSDSIRKTCHAEILAAVLFQTVASNTGNDQTRREQILNLLLKSPYEYILKNYLRVYYYSSPTEEGKMFADLLKQHDFVV